MLKSTHHTFTVKEKNTGIVLANSIENVLPWGLTHDHFYKIKMADVVFIYNEQGYIGTSTTLEIGYAVALGKPIYALSQDSEEICRNILIRDIVKSPDDLVKVLR